MDLKYYLSLGDQAYFEGRLENARSEWRKAMQECHDASQYIVLAGRFLSLGFLTEARETLKRVSKCDADTDLIALESALALERGDVAECLRLLDLNTVNSHLTLWSNRLLVGNYEKKRQPKEWSEEAGAWAVRALQLKASPQTGWREADKGPVIKTFENRTGNFNVAHHEPDRHVVNVGFVSGDLCAHPVGFLLFPIFQELKSRQEQQKAKLWVYNNTSQSDWMTDRLKSIVSPECWREVLGLDDENAQNVISHDKLDILVDCSGHTARNRLPLFVQRLAPVQISWGGYFSTTGLPTIDFVIMDKHHVVEKTQSEFIEKIIPFPSRFIYRPPPFPLPITDVPFFRNGYVTFGSFNNIAKVNDDVIAVWSSILKSVPGSRLILKWRCFADRETCSRTEKRWAEHGLDPERIELRPFSPYRETLAEYRDVDIALDPFPFTGGQTSLDALWMGLPLVTLAGDTPVSRQGHAFVNLIGRPVWSASNAEDYICLARNLTSDPSHLRAIRYEQRDLIRSSFLWNSQAFVDELLKLCKTVPRK